MHSLVDNFTDLWLEFNHLHLYAYNRDNGTEAALGKIKASANKWS